jgi:K+-sensing histidine kinase KdpD
MLHNNRKRETRIYNKLNLIRGILLKNSSNTLIQSYIETKYGSTEIKKFELNHTQQARSIYVLIGIFYMWFTVLAYLYTKSINDKATVIMGYLVAIVVIYFVTIYIYKSYTIRESITDPAQK